MDSRKYREIRVFIGSPGDVADERACARRVVNDLDQELGHLLGVRLTPVMWETHSSPDMGRPQGIVNRQIGTFDIFIGLMWKRFGSPTGKAHSGTEEEYNNAYKKWCADGFPRIMFYFCTRSYRIKTHEEGEQLLRVIEFRDRIANKGLFSEYETLTDFERKLRHDLNAAIQDIAASTSKLAFFEVDIPHILHTASHVDYLHEAMHTVFAGKAESGSKSSSETNGKDVNTHAESLPRRWWGETGKLELIVEYQRLLKGVYDFGGVKNAGRIHGSCNGRVMKFKWEDRNGVESGNGYFILSDDRSRLEGAYFHDYDNVQLEEAIGGKHKELGTRWTFKRDTS